MKSVNRFILLFIIVQILITGCSNSFYPSQVLKDWRSDPNGCKNIRSITNRLEIVKFAEKCTLKERRKLLKLLGPPDRKIVIERGTFYIYYIDGKCKDLLLINDKYASRLEVLINSKRVEFSIADI